MDLKSKSKKKTEKKLNLFEILKTFASVCSKIFYTHTLAKTVKMSATPPLLILLKRGSHALYY